MIFLLILPQINWDILAEGMSIHVQNTQIHPIEMDVNSALKRWHKWCDAHAILVNSNIKQCQYHFGQDRLILNKILSLFSIISPPFAYGLRTRFIINENLQWSSHVKFTLDISSLSWITRALFVELHKTYYSSRLKPIQNHTNEHAITCSSCSTLKSAR